MAGKRRKEEYAEATRAALVEMARALFAERGFAPVSIEEIVQGARVTRGALYHHFDDKQALFQAVLETVEGEIAGRMRGRGRPGERPLGAGRGRLPGLPGRQPGARHPADPRRRSLGAGLAHLVRHRSATRSGVLQGLFEAASEAGLIDPQPIESVALLVLGALNTGGRVIAEAKQPAEARQQVGATVDRLLSGLRKTRPRRA